MVDQSGRDRPEGQRVVKMLLRQNFGVLVAGGQLQSTAEVQLSRRYRTPKCSHSVVYPAFGHKWFNTLLMTLSGISSPEKRRE